MSAEPAWRLTGRKPRAEKILDALEQLLTTAPLRALEVEQIAEGAGISRPRFYYYFKSKHSAMAALLERTCDEVFHLHADTAGGWYDRAPDVRPRLAMLETSRLRAQTLVKHRAVFLEASDLWNSDPEIRDTWLRYNRHVIKMIETTIERERALGLAPPGPDAHQLAKSLYWMGERMLFFTYADEDDSLTPLELADLMVQLFMRTIYLRDDPDPQ